MEVVEETKSNYNMDYIEKINNISNLSFNFDYKNRFIYSNFEDDSNLVIETSFLKILKPIHISNNKKKISSKKYIILEILKNTDNQDDFLLVLNKVHEISQNNIRNNSLSWFNTEFDDFALDMKVRRPIDNQKNTDFIKFVIDNEYLCDKVEKLEKNNYISCKIKFNGLKINSDHLMEEWELVNFITQEEYDAEYFNLENTNEKSISEYLTESFINNEKIYNTRESNYEDKNNYIENNEKLNNSIIEKSTENNEVILENSEENLEEVKENLDDEENLDNEEDNAEENLDNEENNVEENNILDEKQINNLEDNHTKNENLELDNNELNETIENKISTELEQLNENLDSNLDKTINSENSSITYNKDNIEDEEKSKTNKKISRDNKIILRRKTKKLVFI